LVNDFDLRVGYFQMAALGASARRRLVRVLGRNNQCGIFDAGSVRLTLKSQLAAFGFDWLLSFGLVFSPCGSL
jgi:hypothetical protein